MTEKIHTHKFISPPAPTMRISFGEESNTFFNIYSKKMPNSFQRWMIRKVFGILIEEIK